MTNITLALKLSDFTFQHDQISSLFRLEPVISYKMGDEYLVNFKKEYRKTNYWDYRIHIKNNTVWIQTIINKFVEETLFHNTGAFEKLKGLCSFELYICVWYFENLDTFHFDLDTLKFLAKHNIEVDIDQYLYAAPDPKARRSV